MAAIAAPVGPAPDSGGGGAWTVRDGAVGPVELIGVEEGALAPDILVSGPVPFEVPVVFVLAPEDEFGIWDDGGVAFVLETELAEGVSGVGLDGVEFNGERADAILYIRY